MKKQILIIVISFFIFSCGSRKVSKSNTEEKVKEKETELVKKDIVTTDNIKIETTTKTDEVTGEEIEETEVVPIDESKTAIYKGDTLKNTKLVKRKIKRNKALKSETNTNTSNDSKKHDKTTATSQKEKQIQKNEKGKEVEKKGLDTIAMIILKYWWFILLLIFACLIFKKYKSTILTP